MEASLRLSRLLPQEATDASLPTLSMSQWAPAMPLINDNTHIIRRSRTLRGALALEQKETESDLLDGQRRSGDYTRAERERPADPVQNLSYRYRSSTQPHRQTT